MAIRGRGILLVTLVVVIALAAIASAQVTFSREWIPGKKRSGAPVSLDCGQFARLCRHFLHELKASMNEKNGISDESHKRRRSHEDSSTFYEDE